MVATFGDLLATRASISSSKASRASIMSISSYSRVPDVVSPSVVSGRERVGVVGVVP